MTQAHSRTIALPPDIRHELFSWVFESEEFRAWQKAESRWQLRVIGGPGTGKTTLARLASARLWSQTPVAAIFMRYGCPLPAGRVVADVLSGIRRQLLSHGHDEENIALSDDEPLDCIRQSLNAILSRAEHAFLVIDGLDQCGREAWCRLEGELSELQNNGLSILAASRVPCGKGMPIYNCDECSREKLQIYWQCHGCRKEEYAVCGYCKMDTTICPKHQLVLSEPYDRVYIDVGNTPSPVIAEYIRWDLEREHGDLGLGSSNDLKPPSSSLGKALTRHSSSSAAPDLVARIAHKVNGDITQARLRLDLVREAETVDDTKPTIDRLPSSMTALFEAGIKSIQDQEVPWSRLGLDAICLVTEGDVNQGVEVKKFMDRLQNLCSQSHSLEGVLHASRGFLSLSSDEDGNKIVCAYHCDFFFYVLEDYNEVLSAVRKKTVASRV